MGLTVTNTNTLTLLHTLNRTTSAQSNIMRQLTTGLRINAAADDPAGLLALESFNAEITAVDAAINNNQRSDALLSVADSGLGELSSLLGDIEELVAASSSSSGVTASELAANQAQIDQALQAIDRIVNTTSFNGKRLLDGSQSIVTTGVDTTELSNVRVYSRGNNTSDVTVSAVITTAAAKANANLGTAMSTATLTSATSIQVTGSLGTATVDLAAGDNRAAIVTKVNAVTAQTGVRASSVSTDLKLYSSGYGSDDFVSASVLSGGGYTGGSTLNGVTYTKGTDAVVKINGQNADVSGLDVNFNANGMSLSFSMKESFGTTTGNSVFTVDVDSGGATFQLGTEASTRTTIGINSMASSQLGGGDSGGFLNQIAGGKSFDLNTDAGKAMQIVRKAISDVASARGRVGGFQKFQVQTSINSLNAAKTGLTAARSVVGDTDFAVATAELNRQNVLLNSSIALLGVANQQTSRILSLLG